MKKTLKGIWRIFKSLITAIVVLVGMFVIIPILPILMICGFTEDNGE